MSTEKSADGPPPQYSPPMQGGYPPQAPPPAGYAGPPGPYTQQPPPTGAYPQQQPPMGGYPAQPMQPGVPPPPGAYTGAPGQTTVMMTQVVTQSFRESPVTCQCPHCSAQITTTTHYETGTMTHIAAGAVCGLGFFLVCLWLGCCFIPYCVNATKDVVHTCPNCNQQISRYNRLS